MAFIYILESAKDGRYYIRSTTNLEKRLKHHRSGATPLTRQYGGIRLIFFQEFPLLKQARFVERKLKRLKRKDYIKKIIKDGFIKMNIPA